jgi:2-C-methyl-D-erythritol 4-phosphate cytidylyltransferase
MKDYLIIVAGGVGQRMGSSIPKQFLDLAGKPVILRTIEKFEECYPELSLYVVIPSEYHDHWNDIVSQFKPDLGCQVVSGGRTRFESVLNGLNAIEGPDGVVGIHDAVRPFVSSETIVRCFERARELGNAVPVIPISDSIRRIEKDGNSISVDRSELRLVQTPQCFDLKLIRAAYSQVRETTFLDDATVVEASGISINLVDGNSENIKLTLPSDMDRARTMI